MKCSPRSFFYAYLVHWDRFFCRFYYCNFLKTPFQHWTCFSGICKFLKRHSIIGHASPGFVLLKKKIPFQWSVIFLKRHSIIGHVSRWSVQFLKHHSIIGHASPGSVIFLKRHSIIGHASPGFVLF